MDSIVNRAQTESLSAFIDMDILSDTYDSKSGAW